jgi:hypothetical protein
MSEEQQQQDHDFFARLNRYEETPPPEVREALQEKMAEKKKRRVGFIWWNSIHSYRIAAVLVAGLLLFYFLRDGRQSDLPSVTEKSAPVTAPTTAPAPSSVDQSSLSTDPDSTIPDYPATPTLQHSSSDIPPTQMAQKSPDRSDRRKNGKASSEESIHSTVAPVPAPQREIVYSTTSPGDENPFAPEESGSNVFSSGSACEDEIVTAVEPPVSVMETTPGPLFPDSLKNGRKNAYGVSWLLTLSGGVSQWKNIYTDGAQPIASNSLERAEQQKISFLGGAELSAVIGSWVITSGLNYSRQEEDWSFKSLSTIFGESGTAFVYNDTTFGSYTLLNGSEAVWSDPPVPGITSTSAAVKVADTQVRNEYTRLSIPLLVGYRFKTGRNMSIGLHTGIAYTNLLNADVWFYNIQEQRVAQTSERSNLYRRNSFDVLFRVEAAVAISDRLSLMLRPAGSLMLTSLYNDQYAAKRSSFRQSVEGGVIWKW